MASHRVEGTVPQVGRRTPYRPRPRAKPKARSAGRTRTRTGEPSRALRIEPGLRAIFDRIGIPKAAPFRPDPFQLEALSRLQESDVIVSAPTGAGKTWIATEAIRRHLERDCRVWYASPLKALSNSLYQEFCRQFGAHVCGIITGDRKENPDAPLLVGTTEILRNQLYDAMHDGTSLKSDLVILDEAHYLSDPERGVVWEEVLIYLPSRVRLLLLSATISNPEELCAWLQEVRGTPASVVRSTERPVPLETLVLLPEGLLVPLAGAKRLHPKVWKLSSLSGAKSKKGREPAFDLGGVLAGLRSRDLLPAIFFLKSRAECDRALGHCPPVEMTREIRIRLREAVKEFVDEHPHLRHHRQIRPLLESRVASHHGGQLPYWKVLIETLMNQGLLEAIFSTSTVAAGVNFPARTVVLVQSDRFNGRDFVDLTATELHQMTGRAGRRGKDRVGFVVLLPGPHQDPHLIFELIRSPAEPLTSQIRVNFSMVLNLLLSHRPEEVRGLFEASFAAFQAQSSAGAIKEQWKRMKRRLGLLLAEGRCDAEDPFEIAEYWAEVAMRRAQAGERSRGVYEGLPCRDCPQRRRCHGRRKGELGRIVEEFWEGFPDLEHTVEGLWLSFKRHLRLLKATGFVDEEDRLTSDGLWASQLRVDQPLLIAEAIRQGAFEGTDPELLAGGLAPFVWDRSQEVALTTHQRPDLSPVHRRVDRLRRAVRGIRRLKQMRGFETPHLLFWPSAALYLWAQGWEWDMLTRIVTADEGDLASLIMRTADHLRQVANLEKTHPDLALTAQDAIRRILREPVHFS